MRNFPDDAIAAYAKSEQRALVTRDFDFADIRNYPPAEYPGIVVVQLSEDASTRREPLRVHGVADADRDRRPFCPHASFIFVALRMSGPWVPGPPRRACARHHS